MKHSIFLVSMLSLLVAGCNQPGADGELSKLKKTNTELSTQLEAAKERIKETESTVASLKAEMDAFTQTYDSDKRIQLAKNIGTIEQLLNGVRHDTESASSTLKEAQALKAEIEKIKDQCVKHEAEAGDANQVGQVKASLANLEQLVNKLKRSVGSAPSIGGSVRQLENKVRQLESKVRRLH